jgi:hypothetical protein
MIAGVVGQSDTAGQNFYAFVHNGFVGQLQLYAFVAGSGTIISSYAVALSPGTFQLELDLRPGQQSGKLNGTVVCSATDTSVTTNSHAGLTFNNTSSSGADLVSAFGAADVPATAVVTPDDSRLANAYSPLQWRVTSTAAAATIAGSEMNFTWHELLARPRSLPLEQCRLRVSRAGLQHRRCPPDPGAARLRPDLALTRIGIVRRDSHGKAHLPHRQQHHHEPVDR